MMETYPKADYGPEPEKGEKGVGGSETV